MSFQDIEATGTFPMKKDPIANTQDTTHALAAGVFQIHTAVSTFKRLVNNLGSSKDTPQLREKLHKTRQHVRDLVKETSGKLEAASEIDHKAIASPNKKVADAKLAKDFESILKEFQKFQKIAVDHEAAYLPFVPQVVLPSRDNSRELNHMPEDNREKRALLIEQRRQEVFQLEGEVVFNEAVIEEQEQGIREVQQQIGEVHEMFKDLAVLVQHQGIIIDDIDTNIERSHAATAQANEQLVKAARNQKSSLSLSCLLLFICGMALFILIIVVAA